MLSRSKRYERTPNFQRSKFETVGHFQNGPQINEPDSACAKEQAR